MNYILLVIIFCIWWFTMGAIGLTIHMNKKPKSLKKKLEEVKRKSWGISPLSDSMIEVLFYIIAYILYSPEGIWMLIKGIFCNPD